MPDLITKALDTLGKRLSNRASGPPVPYVSKRGNLFNNGSDGMDIAERAYEAYGAVGTLFAIVSMIANAVAQTEWALYRKSLTRDKDKRKEVTDHAIVTLWNKPNPFYSGRLFRETCQQHLDLVGETTIVLVTVGNIVIEMWPVRPDRMKPVKSPTKFLTGWVYESADGEKIPLQLDQVIQIKYPNPSDPYRGLGPVQSALMHLDSSRYAATWNKNFFINGARPGGIIEVDYRMSDPEWEEFTERWRRQHQGVSNAHRVAVLENAKWQDVAFNMSDMQFVEMQDLSRELIREAFAFPKPMLGSVDDVNRANAEMGEEIFSRWQQLPRLERWKDILNNDFVPRFQSGRLLEMDFGDPVPVNQAQQDQRRNSQWASARLGVTAGYHPDDVAEAIGLPRMRWVGIPAAAGPYPDPELAPEGAQPGTPTQGGGTVPAENVILGKKTMPIIDSVIDMEPING